MTRLNERPWRSSLRDSDHDSNLDNHSSSNSGDSSQNGFATHRSLYDSRRIHDADSDVHTTEHGKITCDESHSNSLAPSVLDEPAGSHLDSEWVPSLGANPKQIDKEKSRSSFDFQEGPSSASVARLAALLPVSEGNSGRFKIMGELARGGIGVILRGYDEVLNRELAVKMLLDRHADDHQVRQRFVEEAQIGGQLSHPGVVTVHELGQLPDNRLYFTMRLVSGQTLSQLLKARPHLSHDLTRFLAIFEQTARTVAYAHSKRVIHRDLKPSNIMVGNFGEVQVMDWGMAKVLDRGSSDAVRTVRTESDEDETLFGEVIGTPSYMSPEQALGQNDFQDERSDVFGLGAILCEILTGRPPYRGRNALVKAERADLSDAYQRLDECGADEELITLAKNCLTVNPEDRLPDASAVALAIATYQENVRTRLSQAELNALKANSKADEELKRRRVLGIAFSAAALLNLVLLLGIWGYASSHRQNLAENSALQLYTHAWEEFAIAKTAQNDLGRWSQAHDSQRAVQEILGKLDSSSPLRKPLANLVKQINLEFSHAQLQHQADQNRVKTEEVARRLANLLFVLRIHHHEWNFSELHTAYQALFEQFGIFSEPKGLASTRRLKSLSANTMEEIIQSLDRWTQAQYRNGASTWKNLSRFTNQIDPDSNRCQVRDAILTNSTKTLKEMSQPSKFHGLSLNSKVLLALAVEFWLHDRDQAIVLLRQTQKQHPQSFEAAFELAQQLSQGDEPSRQNAIVYYRVAQALQPESGQALIHALRRCGQEQEALDVAQALGSQTNTKLAEIRALIRSSLSEKNEQSAITRE